MDHIIRLSLGQGHIEGRKHELRTQMELHGPAHDLPAPDVEDDGGEVALEFFAG